MYIHVPCTVAVYHIFPKLPMDDVACAVEVPADP